MKRSSSHQRKQKHGEQPLNQTRPQSKAASSPYLSRLQYSNLYSGLSSTCQGNQPQDQDFHVRPLFSGGRNYRPSSNPLTASWFLKRSSQATTTRLGLNPLTSIQRSISRSTQSTPQKPIASSTSDIFHFTEPPSAEELSLPLGDSVRILTKNEITERLALQKPQSSHRTSGRRKGTTTSGRFNSSTRRHIIPMQPQSMNSTPQDVMDPLGLSPIDGRSIHGHHVNHEKPLQPRRSSNQQQDGSRHISPQRTRQTTSQQDFLENRDQSIQGQDMALPSGIADRSKSRSRTPTRQRLQSQSQQVYHDDGLFTRNSATRDPHQSQSQHTVFPSSSSSSRRRLSSISSRASRSDADLTGKPVEDRQGHHDIIGSASDLEQMKRRASYFRVHRDYQPSHYEGVAIQAPSPNVFVHGQVLNHDVHRD